MSRIILKRSVAILGLAFCISMLSACSGDANKTGQIAQSGSVTVVAGKADIGGAYDLIDHTGKTVTDKNFLGKSQLIFFGFANCPDVCPTALQQMAAALELAGGAADAYQPIFITIDPGRDTPEALAEFVTISVYPSGLIGLTGSSEQIEGVKKVFKVYGQKAADPEDASAFTFNHSSLIYLMDKNGEFVDVFSHTTTPRDMADRLIQHKKTGQ